MSTSEDTNKAIAASSVLGIIHAVGIEIVIGGKVLSHYHSFQLQQSTREHHSFVLVLAHDVLDETQQYDMEQARNFLGQSLSVTFVYRNIGRTGPSRRFKGVVTDIAFSQEHGHQGHIVLTGSSPTILLDAAPHTQSFSDTSLQGLAEELIAQGTDGQQLNTAIRVAFRGNLSYTCQYNESHYNYLARMAATYGEWFFYDGDTLCFGRPVLPTPITLIYGRDCRQIRVRMKTEHVNLKHYGYNSNTDQELSGEEPEVGYLGELGNYAYHESKRIFKTPSLQGGRMRARFDGDVSATETGGIGARAAALFSVTGSTSIPFLHPGCLIEVNFRKPESSEARYFSRMMVTEVSHSLDSIGNYQNHFEAIPSDVKHIPQAFFQMPTAEAQVATVTSNSDGQGRVKVRFQWQTKGETTDFIRVMTPDAGSSDQVGQNRACGFIPELGDQVMVGFQHNHPDRPFVMGGMFTGKIGLGGGGDNHLKTIYTRSGNTIQFDDADGQGSITVKDASGNAIYMDGKGNITITASTNDITVNAPETMTFNAKNVIINAEENVRVEAGNNMLAVTKNKIEMNAGTDMYQYATGNLHANAGKILDLYGKEQLINHSKQIDIGAKDNLHVHGKQTKLTAEDKIEYRAPEMNKLPQKGKFKYTKEPEIVEVYWLDAESHKEKRIIHKNEKASIKVITRNLSEGEEVVIDVDEVLTNENIKKHVFKGTVDKNGIAILNEIINLIN